MNVIAAVCGGRIRTHVDHPCRSFPPPVAFASPISRHFRDLGTALGQCRDSIPLIQSHANAKICRKIAELSLPRQIGLFLPMEVLEIIGVHFDGIGRVRGIRTCRAFPHRARRGTRGRGGLL